jgi:hypothetical protein
VDGSIFAGKLVEWTLPANEDWEGRRRVLRDGTMPYYARRRGMMACEVDRLGLPPTALDSLLEGLGGEGAVAELTGRVHRWEGGRAVRRKRGDNVREIERFMRGDKLVAVVSDAESVGISLHADLGAGNRRRRVHLTLEQAWSADRALQQLGRTNRSNQASGPIYRAVYTDAPSEKRFAQALARKLRALGAMSHGEARVAEECIEIDDEEEGGRAVYELMDEFRANSVGGLRALRGLETRPENVDRLIKCARHARACEGFCDYAWCAEARRRLRGGREALGLRPGARCSHGVAWTGECAGCGSLGWCEVPEAWDAVAACTALGDLFALMRDERTTAMWMNQMEGRRGHRGAEALTRFYNRMLCLPIVHQRAVRALYVSARDRMRAREALLRPTFGEAEASVEVVEGPRVIYRERGGGCPLWAYTLRGASGCEFDELLRDLRARSGGGSEDEGLFATLERLNTRGLQVTFHVRASVVVMQMRARGGQYWWTTSRICRKGYAEGLHSSLGAACEREDEIRAAWRPGAEESHLVCGALFSAWSELEAHVTNGVGRMRAIAVNTRAMGRLVGVCVDMDEAFMDMLKELRRRSAGMRNRLELCGFQPRDVPDEPCAAWYRDSSRSSMLVHLGFALGEGCRVCELSWLRGVPLGSRLRAWGDWDIPTLDFFKRRFKRWCAPSRAGGHRLVFMREDTAEEIAEAERFEREGMHAEEEDPLNYKVSAQC